MKRLLPRALFMSLVCALFAVAAPGIAAAADTGWPGLRGPDHDGAVRQARLFAAAGEPGLAIGWKVDLGSGYSGVAAADGKVVTMFAAGDADVAAAFDADTGKELWRYRIADAYKGHDGSHDGPISSPHLAGGKVYGLGPRGQLFALDAATGKVLWSKDVASEHGAKKPHYGFTTSPILVDGVLVVEIGAGEGKAVAGFNPDNGALLWSAGDDEINYHSPIAATIGGKKVVLAAGGKTLLGLEAATGKVLFSYAHQGDAAATGGQTIIPVPAGEGRFLLHHKSDGSVMLSVTTKGSAYEIAEVWANNSFRGTYVIPVYHDGHLYGVSGRVLDCVDAATGETKWRSREPGDGFVTLVGEQLVIMTKPGSLHVADASPQAYRERAGLDLFDVHSWSAVAFAGGRLYARSMAHLARIDITSEAKKDEGPSWIAGTAFGRFLDEVTKASDKKTAVDAYLAKQKSFPIVEENGAVHFVYRGPAKDVGIVGDMVGFRCEDPMRQVPGTDLFYYSMRLEPDAAVSYGFLVDYGKASADTLNPRPGKGLFGDVSWMSMPAWKEPALFAEAAKDKQGRLETIEWDSKVREGQKRTAQVYLPAGYDAKSERRYPVLYLHNGKDALDNGGLKNVLDNMIGSQVDPLIAVFVASDPNNRRDLGEVEPYTEMVVSELVPKVDASYRTIPQASARATAGAGDAAQPALFSAFKRSDVFGRVGVKSAFVMKGTDYDEMLSDADRVPLVIYMDWGTYHMRSPNEAWDMARGNRELWSVLRQKGYRPSGGEAPEGFGWACWRGRVGQMLTALFPLKREG